MLLQVLLPSTSASMFVLNVISAQMQNAQRTFVPISAQDITFAQMATTTISATLAARLFLSALTLIPEITNATFAVLLLQDARTARSRITFAKSAATRFLIAQMKTRIITVTFAAQFSPNAIQITELITANTAVRSLQSA